MHVCMSIYVHVELYKHLDYTFELCKRFQFDLAGLWDVLRIKSLLALQAISLSIKQRQLVQRHSPSSKKKTETRFPLKISCNLAERDSATGGRRSQHALQLRHTWVEAGLTWAKPCQDTKIINDFYVSTTSLYPFTCQKKSNLNILEPRNYYGTSSAMSP